MGLKGNKTHFVNEVGHVEYTHDQADI